MADDTPSPLRTLIVDDEPLAVERMQVICAELDHLAVIGTASDGGAALRLVEALSPDLLLLDMTMPEMDGLQVARALAGREVRPAVIFVTAHDDFAVEAFDLEAVDYVLKPVTPERLQRAIGRAVARRGSRAVSTSEWLDEFWVPHRAELIRIEAAQVERIDAERDYVRLHVGQTSYLLLQTIAGLEARLDPSEFIRIHRSCILRRSGIRGLRHEGLGVWSVETAGGEVLRIGRTYLARVKAMTGR
ncbi:MAG: LytTR family DNA-binding domain-containing protein [Candidatus Andeanibacterium colombiense]|uniref:LytTR family DNA-binding domain-containing protein n=1 Tax=Candidatus Andeanibacterium colombiense TaxID=3121345 RepID=A0AAJ5X3L6_9SPHN|nr:MAG: LytTR family DNA-binding domain-containing protein [Sphingomonadaceae bacterium]